MTSSFGAKGSGDGQLELHEPESLNESPSGLAVNDQTGDVYVADTGNRRVDEFSSAGVFIRAFGLNVGGAGVNMCTSGCVKGTSGSTPGAFKAPTLIAIDNSGGLTQGDVYVGDTGDDLVSRFDSSGLLLSAWGAGGQLDGSTAASPPALFPGPFGALNGVAVDAVGNLLVSGTQAAGEHSVLIFRFAPDGGFLTDFLTKFTRNPAGVAVDSTGDIYAVSGSQDVAKLAPDGANINSSITGNAVAVAVDPANDDLYVTQLGAGGIARFDAAGNPLEPLFGENAKTIAIAGPTNPHRAYVASPSAAAPIRVFDLLTLPDAETGAASGVASTTVKLSGTVNPAGTEASYQFEYVTDAEFTASGFAGAAKAPPVPGVVGNDSSVHEESVTLTGLAPSTTYHFRIVGINPAGTTPGQGATFHTTGPPDIGPATASGITGVAATIEGHVNPSGFDTTYTIQYGTSTAYGSETSSTDIGESDEAQSISSQLTGLQASTTYHYRVLATNSQSPAGGTPGPDREFTTEPASQISEQSAGPIAPTCATLTAQVNPDGSQTEVFFEYGPTGSYGTSTTPVAVGSSNEPQPLSTEVCGLSFATTYHFRAVATNAQGTVKGPDVTFTTLPPVSIDSESVSQVTTVSAVLRSDLNPNGLQTEYHFEYDTAPYVQGEAPHGTPIPVPDAGAGSGTADVPVSAPIAGLAASTIYHYRLVASNSLGTVEGPDRSFTTQGPASTLPDGRAWEQVSPTDKNGIALEGIGGLGGDGSDIQAAADGSGLAYISRGPIDAEPAGNRSNMNTQLLARRAATGWSTRDIATPHQNPVGATPGNRSEYLLFTPDLSLGVVEPEGATPLSPQTTERTPYRREANGEYTPFVTAANVAPGVRFGGTEKRESETFSGGVHFVSSNPDGSHAVLTSPQALTPGFESGGRASLYAWSAGTLTLLSEIPSGSAAVCGGAGAACLPAAEEGLNAGLGHDATEGGQKHNAISADGSRVVFETPFQGGGHLYLRDTARGETLQLDALHGGSGGPDLPVFQGASADGSRVFFTDASRLTEDSTAGSGEGSPDLYMCQIGVSAGHLACTMTDLSANTARPAEPANVQGFITSPEDGSSVYFAANGALTEGEGAVHGDCAEEAPGNLCNLYRVDTTTGTIRLVAVLASFDSPDWGGNGIPQLGALTARVSPDGRFFAFMSQRGLTGYDNRDATSGRSDEEVFLYDSKASGGAGVVRCVSCNPTGERPTGLLDEVPYPHLLIDRPQVWEGASLAASVPGWTPLNNSGRSLYQSRYLSNSGRLFFNAADALVPQDSNGNEDVYQFEPPEVGGCSESSASFGKASGGCVSLISSGTSGEESAFLDASESGNDVFILTASKLAPTDVDKALDVYDAHVCSSGWACPPPPPPAPPACEGDACQTPVAPPSDATPGSLTFHGPGNLLPAPPAKAKPPTRAQLFARALRACRTKHNGHTRTRCEKTAHHRYGPTKARKSGHHTTTRSR